MTPTNNTPTPSGEWTEAERATLRRMIRYAIAIFTAIGITLLIVGLIAAMLKL